MPSESYTERESRTGQRLVTFYLDAELLDQLDDKLTRSRFHSRSDFLRSAVTRYVGRQ